MAKVEGQVVAENLCYSFPDETRDIDGEPFTLGQNGSCHAVLAEPPHEIHLAHTKAESGKERGRDGWRNMDIGAWMPLETHEHEQNTSTQIGQRVYAR